MRRFLLPAIFSLGLGTDAAAAKSAKSCGSIVDSQTGVTVSYCFWKDAKNVDPSQAFFFFHGLGGSYQLDHEPLKTIIDLAPQIWEDKPVPVLFSLSLGPEGIAKDLRATAIRNVMARLERDLTGAPTAHRHLVGVSMGGHNALRVLATEPSHFNSIALLCPAVLDIDGYNPAEKTAYLNRHPEINRQFFDRAWSLYQKEFPTGAQWKANNPFEFLKNGAYDHTRFFISIGKQDSLGFLEGSTKLKDALEARGVKVDFATVNGPHCAFDKFALAGYLVDVTE